MGVPLVQQRDLCYRNIICANMVCGADKPISRSKWENSYATLHANNEPNYIKGHEAGFLRLLFRYTDNVGISTYLYSFAKHKL